MIINWLWLVVVYIHINKEGHLKYSHDADKVPDKLRVNEISTVNGENCNGIKINLFQKRISMPTQIIVN